MTIGRYFHNNRPIIGASLFINKVTTRHLAGKRVPLTPKVCGIQKPRGNILILARFQYFLVLSVLQRLWSLWHSGAIQIRLLLLLLSQVHQENSRWNGGSDGLVTSFCFVHVCAVRSQFRACIDSELLRKHNLISPDDYRDVHVPPVPPPSGCLSMALIIVHCVSKKFPPLNCLWLCQILTDFQNFCTAGKRMKFAIKLYYTSHLTLGMLLHKWFVRWGSSSAEGRCHGNQFWDAICYNRLLDYNFGCMIASDMLFDSWGGFLGSNCPMKT